jgi:cell division protein FtsW
MGRIQAFLHPERYASAQAYQAENGTKAVGIGGLTGVGIGESVMKKRGVVPLHYSDMIFSVIAAEKGLLGYMSVIGLYLVFLCTSVFIAWHARDMFGLMIATGVSFFICLQAAVHIGVVTSVIPNTGIPLPFMSHGGTNLMFNLVGVGLLFSIARFGLVRVKSKNPFDRHVDVPVAGTV